MKLRYLVILVSLFTFVLAGCYTHIFEVGSGGGNGKEVYSKWRSHWLFGTIDTNKEMDIKDFCPSGNATIQNEVTFLNGLVGVFIGIIYYPTTVTIVCDNGAKADIELNEEQMNALVNDPRFLEYVADVDSSMVPLAQVAVENASAMK